MAFQVQVSEQVEDLWVVVAICSDRRLMLETSALQTLYSSQFTLFYLSTQFIN